jgi:hypothetical protein
VRCEPRPFGAARPAADIAYFVDRIPVRESLVAIEGWAALPGRAAQAGQVHVILLSEKSRHVFTTVAQDRADVAAAHPRENWRRSGFRFELRPWLLPAENFQIGLLLQTERGREFIMTAHRLELTGPLRGILANGP